MPYTDFGRRRTEKVVVIMGTTGTGKSKLSIDIASKFPCEIINSDKMQVYTGLDITTNKIPISNRRNIPHRLLGDIDSSFGEFTAADFRYHAAAAITSITARRRLPLLVGGSNSFINALVVERFNSQLDYFSTSISSFSTRLRYDCCFLWVDVSFPVLTEYLSRRVDEMIDAGMVEELALFYNKNKIDKSNVGIMKAIGVQEFDRYFRQHHSSTAEENRRRMKDFVKEVKNNTWHLASRQNEKIQRFRSFGWTIHRLDATPAFKSAIQSNAGESLEYWQKDVVKPSINVVRHFLNEDFSNSFSINSSW